MNSFKLQCYRFASQGTFNSDSVALNLLKDELPVIQATGCSYVNSLLWNEPVWKMTWGVYWDLSSGYSKSVFDDSMKKKEIHMA